MLAPSTFPDWALTPPAQGSLNEQQTIIFTGVPASGTFVLNILGVATAPINWNDSNATIVSKINAAYPAGATIASGSVASGTLVIDLGTYSTTYVIPQITITANSMVTSGNAGVATAIYINQTSQLPATVTIDSGHTNNGFMFLEKAAFNLFNAWMNLVGLWVRYLNTQVLTFLASITTINASLASGAKGENLFRNGGFQIAQRGQTGMVSSSSTAYTLDGWMVKAAGNSVVYTNPYVATGLCIQLTPSGTMTDLAISQRIESYLMESIGYTNITIQFYVFNNSNNAITPTLKLNVPTAADNYGSVTNVLPATNLQTIPANTGAVVAYTFAVTNAYSFNYGLEVILDFAAQVVAGSNVQISLADCSATPLLTAGLQAAPPTVKVRNVQTELVACQRYYQVLNSATTGGVIAAGWALSFGQMNSRVNLFEPMRVAPTITLSANSDFEIVTAAGTSSNLTGFTPGGVYGIGTNAFDFIAASGGSFTNYEACFLEANSSSSKVMITAEL